MTAQIKKNNMKAVPKSSGARERVDRIYNEIRDRICMLHYAPNSRLSEDELAEEFGTSRTPIRRVLTRLESDELVESRHGVGTIVTDIDISELIEEYELRQELASMIGTINPQPRSEADLQRMATLIQRCKDLEPQQSPREFARLNLDYYRELASFIGNKPLQKIFLALFYRTSRIWLTTLGVDNYARETLIFRREMEDIYEAMQIGSYQSVGYIHRTHIANSSIRLQEYARAIRAAEE